MAKGHKVRWTGCTSNSVECQYFPELTNSHKQQELEENSKRPIGIPKVIREYSNVL